MFGLITGLVETVARTAIALPVSIIADVATFGGELNDKGGQTYTGDAIDGISEAIKKMNND